MGVSLIEWQTQSSHQKKAALARPTKASALELRSKVESIIAEVRANGDKALHEFTARFDQVDVDSFKVTSEEIEAALEQVDSKTLAAMKLAISNIETFHKSQIRDDLICEVSPGITCKRSFRPIERVGLYAPGGTAPLPSTVMMLAVPAKIAGCPLKVLATPPRKDNTINPHILAAAKLSGITEIYKVGGAQAIAALAFGTESVPKVDKIFGPGNSWVTEAKLQVAQDPDGATYDMPAGPSEVLVIADETANPEFIAADLLSQAEHGKDSQAILVCTSRQIAEKTKEAIERLATSLSRQDILKVSLDYCRLIVCGGLDEAFDISNDYAPEHLILQIEDPERYAAKIINAGSVFMGPWAPESVGDYASGTNHVLPTYGYARNTSGLSIEAFMKAISFQNLSARGLQHIGPSVERLAELEGLDAHKMAVSLRLAAIERGAE